jgi:alkanesulfonate monooxygenase SsuD/methylene tetrahydromethanopterin reductase-like flavin-dependent oxidoreductase (luciferase family)
MFTLRFDMRAPSTGAPTTELYAAALEMTNFAEDRGAVAAVVCEHHGQPDGYLPSPMILATALAARTSSIPIVVAVVVLPLYEPIRLAEEMVVLDIISGGRVSYVCAVGYREDEYDLFGVDFRRRGRIADEWSAVRARRSHRPGHPCAGDGRRPDRVLGRREPGGGPAGRTERPRLLRPV